MIVKLFDGSQLIVTSEQGTKIAQAKANGVNVIEINGSFVDPKGIASIKPGGSLESFKKLPVATYTDEDRKRARKRLKQLRDKFIKNKKKGFT